MMYIAIHQPLTIIGYILLLTYLIYREYTIDAYFIVLIVHYSLVFGSQYILMIIPIVILYLLFLYKENNVHLAGLLACAISISEVMRIGFN